MVDGKQSSRAFREHVADQQSKEVGAKYAQEQRDIAGEQVTTRFLEGLRTHYAGGNRGDQYWTTVTRQSTNNPEETITTPGVLEILNIHVHLYAPVPHHHQEDLYHLDSNNGQSYHVIKLALVVVLHFVYGNY